MIWMAFLGIAFACGASGCQVCNANVCSSTLWVYFQEPGGGPLQAGTYELSVQTDDGEPESATCEVAAGAGSVRCEGLDSTIYTPRFGSPDNPHEVLHLYYDDAPPMGLQVTLVHDGTTLFDGSIDPRYSLAEPGCDDTCRHATERRDFAR